MSVSSPAGGREGMNCVCLHLQEGGRGMNERVFTCRREGRV